jgi:threonine synthase
VERTGAFDLSSRRHAIRSTFGFVSGTSTHRDRLDTIRSCEARYGRLIDPHTADGLFVGAMHREPDVPLVCLETALPAKFAETIAEAVGHAPDRPEAFRDLESRPRRFDIVDADVDAVKRIIASRALSHR